MIVLSFSALFDQIDLINNQQIMLSKLIRSRAIIRYFSTQQTEVEAPSQLAQPFARDVALSPEQERQQILHHQLYRSEVKDQVASRLAINFETENNEKTLIAESQTSMYSFSIFAQTISLATVGHFLYQLQGMISYPTVVGSLLIGGVAGVLSYSNYLKRTHAQILRIYHTNDNKINVVFTKGGLFGRGSSEEDVTVEKKDFQYGVDFGNRYHNIIRNRNDTKWIRIQGQDYWMCVNPRTIQFNAHLYNKLL